MSKGDLERLDDQGLAAWDSHDPDAFVEVFADDFVWHDWTLPEPITDKEAARQFFASWVRAFPDLKTTSVRRVVGDDSVATEVEWTATNAGPLAMGGDELSPTNKRVTGRGAYMWRAREGKIVEFRTHPDVAGIMIQLGVMPAS